MNLPFILKNENIAYIKTDTLFIGDRRVFPFSRAFVSCSSGQEVYSALKEMVTQGGGPLIAALEYMRLCCRRGYSVKKMAEEAALISTARPTNTTMADTLKTFISKAAKTNDPEKIINEIEDFFSRAYEKMGKIGSSLIKDGDTILTTCFAEQSFFLSVMKAVDEGKKIKVAINETRPYLQGSRLTAPSLKELNIPCFLISDGMGANLMSQGKVNSYMTASDMVVRDGYVINKTGTLANAICAKYFGIDYWAFSLTPCFDRPVSDVKLETREGEQLSMFNGLKTTEDGIPGYYPAFDIIPPEFVSGIITPEGMIKC